MAGLRDTVEVAAQMPQTRLVNVCDREADSFELFEEQLRNPSRPSGVKRAGKEAAGFPVAEMYQQGFIQSVYLSKWTHRSRACSRIIWP